MRVDVERADEKREARSERRFAVIEVCRYRSYFRENSRGNYRMAALSEDEYRLLRFQIG